MKNTKSIFLSVLIPVLFLGVFSGCSEPEYAYTIQVKSINGKKLENVNVDLYSNNELVSTSKTNSEGVASFDIERKEYDVKLSNLPDGYYLSKEYKTNATNENYTLTCLSEVIQKVKPDNSKYQIGDIMYDFTLQNTEGENVKLSKLFDKYEMVFLNFFYIDCYWCGIEFPYMEEAYQEYADDVAIVAISFQDNMKALQQFKKDEGFTFDICYDNNMFTNNFNVIGFPTSVVIDRYGVFTEFHEGAIQSKNDFVEIFDKYTGDDYLPSGIPNNGEGEQEGETQTKPTYTMPESSKIEKAINGEGFNYSWYPETDIEDAEYSWPWIISEDGKSIYPSNTGTHNSYGTIYTKVNLRPDQVFMFEYLASTEEYGDILYITVDDTVVNIIHGTTDDWQNFYAYVPGVEGEYEIGFTYLKDGDTNAGDDRVSIRNVRIIPTSEINEPVYIKKHASEVMDPETYRYEQFVDVVLNPDDGYYHVNDVNGPILLADLLGENSTHYSQYSINYLVNEGFFQFGIRDYTQRMLEYCSMASNSYLGMCPVTDELKKILVQFTTYYYNRANASLDGYTPYENQWLDICCYYQGYGTTEQMPDPIKGLGTISAYKAELGDQNFVEFDTLIMPRGKYSLFVPEISGVYKINSIGNDATMAWIYLNDNRENSLYYEFDRGARDYKINEDNQNYCMYVYLEAGTKYYICSAFDDMYKLGKIQFNIEYIGLEMDLFTLCSTGAFTTENDDMTGNIIIKGINIKIGDDGYYHELLNDGSLGSIVYCDFVYPSYHPSSINDLIDNGYFNLTYDKVEETNIDGGKNYTSIMNGYKQLMITEEGITKGCVPVDETLAMILQDFMDVYTFNGVENSWLKLCYYYKHIGV